MEAVLLHLPSRQGLLGSGTLLQVIWFQEKLKGHFRFLNLFIHLENVDHSNEKVLQAA